MKKVTFILGFLLLFSFLVFSQSKTDRSLYLGQTPPDATTPIIFNLQTTAGLRPVERITISTDGTEIYYGEIDAWPTTVKRIKCCKYVNNVWQEPIVVFEGFVAPALSPDNNIMYMQKDMNLNGTIVATTFYSVRNGSDWSTPVRLLSSNMASHYFQKTQSANYYLASAFAGNGDIAKLVINNTDTTIQSLGLPLNSTVIENDFFVARDESYIIFFKYNSPYDLFISFNKNGVWTNPKNLGIVVNTPIYECCPYISPDNTYLFFTQGGNSMDSYSTYWVKIDNIIADLMVSNFVPYLKNTIPSQVATVGQVYNYTTPDNTFFDDDGNNTLTYSAKLSNGNALPTWLNFDPNTHTFSGTPTATETINVRLTATDDALATASTIFKIEAKVATQIIETNNKIVKISPNPSTGLVNIKLDKTTSKSATVEVTNIEGKLILTNSFNNNCTIDLNGNVKGIYIIKVLVDNKIFINKISLN